MIGDPHRFASPAERAAHLLLCFYRGAALAQCRAEGLSDEHIAEGERLAEAQRARYQSQIRDGQGWGYHTS